MTELSPGKIYLAEQRGVTETQLVRQFHTLNFGSYYSEHKGPLGNLLVFNDNLLAASVTDETHINADTIVVIIPVTGALHYTDGYNSNEADAGEILTVGLTAGSRLTITNPYSNDTINYLQLHFNADREFIPKQLNKHCFDLQQNELITIADQHSLPLKMSIGRFSGREEAVYRLAGKGTLIFGFVIAGAFEVQGRLLHERDSLAVWGVPEVELEALSNNAVMLLFEY